MVTCRHSPVLVLRSLKELIAQYEGFTLDENSFLVTFVLTGKTFDGRNLLHLQRFCEGKAYRTLCQARAAGQNRSISVDPPAVEVTTLEVPVFLRDRAASLVEALKMQSWLAHQCRTEFHSLGEAIRGLQSSLSCAQLEKVRCCAYDYEANVARHQGLTMSGYMTSSLIVSQPCEEIFDANSAVASSSHIPTFQIHDDNSSCGEFEWDIFEDLDAHCDTPLPKKRKVELNYVSAAHMDVSGRRRALIEHGN